MKEKREMSETDCSKTYKRLRNNLVSGCPLCSAHRGCNRNGRDNPARSWKEYRKTQWR